MKESCPVCRRNGTKEQGNYRGRHEIFKRMHRRNCPDCGLVFASPMPSESALSEFNSSYFDSAHGGHSMGRVTLAYFAAIARLRADHILRYLAARNLTANRVLEVGPGSGHFAGDWLGRFPDTSYFALETDSTCYPSLRELGVKLRTGGCTEAVDLVVASHVLEHVSDPHSFLQAVTRDLRLGGVLFIEVPCQDWRHKPIDEPHLLFFDKPPMNKLLASLGFTQIQLSYHGREIIEIESMSWLPARWASVRARLINLGLVAPFCQRRLGMEGLDNPLQRAVIAPFEAHLETDRPAWWLRALAVKDNFL